MSDEKLTFRLTNDNRPLREQYLGDSILTEQYKYALRQINEYIGELRLENISEPDHEDSPGKDKQRSETIGSDTDYNNNIFAFIGDRGSGKTSCMITVADFLIRKKEVIDAQNYPHIDKVNFATIDLIDPAYFDNYHNLIPLFLAKLYKSFREKTEEYERDVRNHYDKRELSENIRNKFLDRFRRTQENFYYIMDIIKYENNQDLLEFVDGLSASVNLKQNIKELVDLYMEYIDMKDSILILRIDDVDINEQQAGRMAEAIRKYFIQPNILVLLSLKLKQLEDIRFLELKKLYNDDKNFSNDELREIVDKYIVKLIPHSHRIFMPQHDNYHGKKLLVEYYNLFERGSEDKKRPRSIEFASVRQAVPQLIFWKTRYLFYNSRAHESYIVPENLRELRQLIKLLVVLPNYYETDSRGRALPPNWNNKTVFKQYFFDTWLSNNLPGEYRGDTIRLVNERGNRHVNELVKDILLRRYGTSLREYSEVITTKEWSFADIIAAILYVEKIVSSPVDSKLLFFIKSYYSIRLYEAYDVMTKDKQEENLPVEGEFFIDDETKYLSLSQYQQLTGGALFKNIIANSPLTLEIEKTKIEGMIASCLTLMGQVAAASHNEKLALVNQLTLRVQWVELLMLCVLVDNHSCLFELGRMFYHLPNMKKDSSQYKKLTGGDSFFNDILANEDRGFKTLYNEFEEATIQYKKEESDEAFDIDHSWKSFCTIRNVEVLEGFLAFMRSSSYPRDNAFAFFQAYFNKAVNYKIETYDRDADDKESYSIHFKFLDRVQHLLANTANDTSGLKGEIESILIKAPTLQTPPAPNSENGNPATDHQTNSDI